MHIENVSLKGAAFARRESAQSPHFPRIGKSGKKGATPDLRRDDATDDSILEEPQRVSGAINKF